MARINLSVPDDLHVEMNAHPTVNWSAIAQKAFRLELATKRKGDDMEAVVERLRASKQKEVEERKPGALESGREWARNEASYRQLRKLQALADYDEVPSREIVEIWLGDDDVRPEDFHLFAQTQFGVEDFDDIESDELGWWLEGALEVWEDVKDAL